MNYAERRSFLEGQAVPITVALLLIRIIETSTGDTWTTVRPHLDRLHAGTFTGPTGLFRRRTELSKPQQDLFHKLDITPPKQMIEMTPARP